MELTPEQIAEAKVISDKAVADKVIADKVISDKAIADKVIADAEIEKNKDKTFNQDELNDIIGNRLSKEKIRMLKKLGITDEAEIDAILLKSKDYDTVKAENDTFKSEKEKKGYTDELNDLKASPEFTEFLLTKIDKGENLEEFKTNATAYLVANPKFLSESFKAIDSSINVNKGGAYPDFANMTTDQYLAWRAKNKL